MRPHLTIRLNLDILASIICMLYFAGFFVIMPPIEVSPEPLGGSLTQIFNIIPYLVVLFFILRRWKSFIYTSTRSLNLLFLVGYANFSVFWSESPERTLTDSRRLLITFLFACCLSSRFKIKDYMWMLTLVLGVTAIESILVCLFLPFYGIHSTGEWCGIYTHKNDLGSYMCLNAGICLHMAISNPKRSWILWISFIVSTILIAFSKSTTSLLILITFIFLFFVFKLLQKNRRYRLQAILTIISIIIVMAISIWLLNNLESIVASQGKDLSFTGRAPMWIDLINKISERPVLGYGYNGFWRSSEALNIIAEYKWAGDAHNGFITLWLELGLIGVIIFSLNIIQFFWKSLQKIILYARTCEDFLPMQFLVYVLMNNFSESRLILPSMSFLLYVAIFLSLITEKKNLKLHRTRHIITAINSSN